jgi:hypothetical protein
MDQMCIKASLTTSLRPLKSTLTSRYDARPQHTAPKYCPSNGEATADQLKRNIALPNFYHESAHFPTAAAGYRCPISRDYSTASVGPAASYVLYFVVSIAVLICYNRYMEEKDRRALSAERAWGPFGEETYESFRR